ncbi:MAG TPA: bifunctional YncE family protein/alkaline phosphatase family protein, partial [Thermoleophilaceae bacterium]|nr:bifunctional YncE family protein/alkaline phosphatase family protein [Thermoleophilaceae bacterium]
MRLRTKAAALGSAAAALAGGAFAVAGGGDTAVSPANHVVVTGAKLNPPGKLVKLGNFTAGGAVTSDGRLYFTISAGWSQNDLRVVSLRTGRVVQVVKLPGAEGGIALDNTRHLAYISGVPDTDISEVKMPDSTPGHGGDVIHVYSWSPKTGRATFERVIPVPPPSTAPAPQNFPPNPAAKKYSWPGRLAVSPDGSRLLVPLELADAAAVVDTKSNSVRYVETGSYPFAAAILPDGKTGLVSNQGGSGKATVSVVDLAGAKKVKDIDVGPHLAHPATIALDRRGARAYIPLSNADSVAVVDTKKMALARTLSTRRSEGEGTAPVDAAVSFDGTRLMVAESAANEIAFFALPGARGRKPFARIGRVPTADYPTDVDSVARKAELACEAGAAKRSKASRRKAKTCSKLVWASAKGFGLGPNAGPPFTSQVFDIPVAYNTKGKVTGYAGITDFPVKPARFKALTRAATAQLRPLNRSQAPADTPLRPNGPIKHVFYIVRENRTYDQVLGDEPRGEGDPRYAIFGKQVTPNAHALVQRFPLLDRFYANSEASIDGHYWTAASDNSDYVHRTWRENYAGRGYPSDAWFFQIAYPQSGFIFDRADQQNVSWVNLGEAVAHEVPAADKDRSPEDQQGVLRRFSKTDLGPAAGGCYDPFIGTDDLASVAGVPLRTYDSASPAGGAQPSTSRTDCFRTKFAAWVAQDNLPSLVYLTLPNDHTRGGTPGLHTPRAMVADNDLGLGQVIDTISHSKYWMNSAIFVVEDDSQDGMDHVDAHRIPAFVVSPYAKQNAVVHTRYDFPSVVRSIGLILGLKPLNLFDAQAEPMYGAFTGSPANAEPYTAVPA